MAALSDEAQPPEETVDRVGQRLRAEATPAEASKLGTSLIVLFGLKYERDRLAELFARLLMAINIEDSSAVELFRSQGAVRGAREILIELGSDRLGRPDTAALAAMNRIDDVDRFKQLAHRLQSVSSWQELLDLKTP